MKTEQTHVVFLIIVETIFAMDNLATAAMKNIENKQYPQAEQMFIALTKLYNEFDTLLKNLQLPENLDKFNDTLNIFDIKKENIKNTIKFANLYFKIKFAN